MLCSDCWNKFRSDLMGQVDKAGNEVIDLSLTKAGRYAFSNNFFPVYVTSKKEIQRGAKKGQFKKSENLILFKSSFCPKCGDKFEEES